MDSIIGHIYEFRYFKDNKTLFCEDDYMFFIFGVSPKKDKLDFSQNIVCPSCGRYGRYGAFMEYTCFSLFFIPVLKWDKKYYVKGSCCSSIYSISNDIGDKICRGEGVDLTKHNLRLVKGGHIFPVKRPTKQCTNCDFKFEMDDDFQYCPKCGAALK